MDATDQDLVRRCLAGEREAFGGIVDKYQDMVFSIALRMILDREEALDLTQAALLKAWENLGSYKDAYPFRTWLYTITLNLVRNHLRRRGLIRFISLSALWEKEGDGPDIADGGGRDTGLKDDIDRALARLPAPLREPFILFYIHDLPVREISLATGLSENAVRIKLSRGRDMFRGVFSQLQEEGL